MTFNFIHRSIPLLSLSLILFIGAVALPANTYANGKKQESEIIKALRAHDLEVDKRSNNSDDVDFYMEDIRTHIGGTKNKKLQKVLENIEIIVGAERAKIGKARLIERLKTIDDQYNHHWYKSQKIYFIPTKDLKKAASLEHEKKRKILKLTLELKYPKSLSTEAINQKRKALFIAENDLTSKEVSEIKTLLIRLQIMEQGQEIISSNEVSKDMLKRAYEMLEEEDSNRNDFNLLKILYGKTRYEEVQKALKDSYVDDPTLEQFSQARHELLSGPSLTPVAQLRIIAVRYKDDLAAGWDKKKYGELANELNTEVGRSNYPDVRKLNSQKR